MKRIGWVVKNGSIIIPGTTGCTRSAVIDEYCEMRKGRGFDRIMWKRAVRAGWLKLIPVYVEADDA